MPTLKLKKGEIRVPKSLVIRMADRMHRLGSATMRENYIARAQKRLEAGHRGKNDAAISKAAQRGSAFLRPSGRARAGRRPKASGSTEGRTLGYSSIMIAGLLIAAAGQVAVAVPVSTPPMLR